MNEIDWFHVILKSLLDRNAFNNTAIDITGDIKAIWDQSEDKDNDLNRITTATRRIEQAGFAKFQPKVYLDPEVYHKDLEHEKIRGILELEGFKYILSKERDATVDDSLIRTNRSVRRTNRIQIGSLIITGAAIVASFVYQKCSYDILREDFTIKKEQLKDTALVRQRQESTAATLDSIHKSLDTISSKIQRRK